MQNITVVIPAYNSARYICDAIDSVLNQTFKDYEIIVVDDGSTDNTMEVLKKYETVIRYIFQENKGPNAARNAGIINSSASYIAFLDADDVWLPQKLEKQMELLSAEPELGLVGCGFYKIDESDNIIQQANGASYKDRGSLLKDLSIRSIASGSASGIIISRECFKKSGLFDESLRGSEDRDMWLRIIRNYEAKFVSEPLVRIRIHKHNAHKNILLMKCNRRKFIRKHSVNMDWFVRFKAYSHLYLDSAREYYEAGRRFPAMLNAFAAIVRYPLMVYQGDDKYKIFIKSFIPGALLKLRKKCFKALASLSSFFDSKGSFCWLPSYFTRGVSLCAAPRFFGLKHLLFCFVDHFEPFTGGADRVRAEARIKAWVDGYGKMADKHSDADGKAPQHTWFYPPHHDQVFLENLVDLCKRGYGEIEMHLHHNRMDPFPDTEETLRHKIHKCIEDYSKHGIFCLPDGSRRFAFIHGDWSLDNSRGKDICGINNEITILRECGCYADFTYPSLGKAQPAMVNRIYYAKDNPDKPKSYNRGRELRAGAKPWGDLLMISGVIGLRWKSRIHKLKPSIEASNIDKSDYPFPGRIDYWVKNAVKIKGRPDWYFIKMHTHGAKEAGFESIFGAAANKMYDYLERKYNDKNDYFLHYVTAREMYNIIKAAEAGESGDPGKFRDYEIKKYVYAYNK